MLFDSCCPLTPTCSVQHSAFSFVEKIRAMLSVRGGETNIMFNRSNNTTVNISPKLQQYNNNNM